MKKKLSYLKLKSINDEWEKIKADKEQREKKIIDECIVLGINPDKAIAEEVEKYNKIIKSFLEKTIKSIS